MLTLIVLGKGVVMRIINNKLIDEFIKKKTDIKNFSSSYIKKIQDWINNYPRKLFNYKSANDIFYENFNDCLMCCNRF